MDHEDDDTPRLLGEWYGHRRREALDALLRREVPRVREEVRRRLGPRLRGKLESMDIVQEALGEFLCYGPPVPPSDGRALRSLLVRIVENTIRDRNDWFTARRREMHRERPLPGDSRIHLDPPVRGVATPSEEASRREWEAWARLGLEMADPEDRRLVLLRRWDGLGFAEIGERLGISPDAARMRFHRALVRLAGLVDRLRREGKGGG